MPWTHALDLTKASVKSAGVDTAVVRAARIVPIEVLRLIRTGDDTIRQARALMPHGAGNQKSDMKHHPEAGARTAAAQIAYAQVGGVPFNPGKPQTVAGASLMYLSGNCQDQAAVVYLLLREKLGAGAIVSYGCAPTYHHSFCIVRPAGALSHDECVVVDPWPKYAQAVRWVDHFTYPDWQLYIERPGRERPANSHMRSVSTAIRRLSTPSRTRRSGAGRMPTHGTISGPALRSRCWFTTATTWTWCSRGRNLPPDQ